MLLQNQKNLIEELLRAGQRPIEIARLLNISKHRVYLYLDDIDKAKVLIPCHYCRQPMQFKWGRRHKYHKECQARVDYQARDHNRQRTQPDGVFERIALEIYKARGYAILWMPWHCPFDYVVNGIRVDVKGANPTPSKGRFHFALQADMQSRCDVLHCIALTKSRPRHYLIPSAPLGHLTQIAINPDSGYKQKWGQYEDQWWWLTAIAQ